MLHLMLLAMLQQPRPLRHDVIIGPQPSRLYPHLVRADTIVHRAIVHNWQEPALIGGAVLGGVSDLFVYGFCTVSDTHPNDQCVIPGEQGFLIGGAIGGTIGALIGASARPATPPPGFETHGNRGRYGALMLGIPTAAVDVYGMAYYCGHPHFGCTAANVLSSVVVTAIDAGIGYLIGKGIPNFRPVAASP